MVLLLKKRKNICFTNKIHKRPAIAVNFSFQLGFFFFFFQLQPLYTPPSFQFFSSFFPFLLPPYNFGDEELATYINRCCLQHKTCDHNERSHLHILVCPPSLSLDPRSYLSLLSATLSHFLSLPLLLLSLSTTKERKRKEEKERACLYASNMGV